MNPLDCLNKSIYLEKEEQLENKKDPLVKPKLKISQCAKKILEIPLVTYRKKITKNIWTIDETDKLLSLHKKYGSKTKRRTNWKAIALQIPGKSHRQCRQKMYNINAYESARLTKIQLVYFKNLYQKALSDSSGSISFANLALDMNAKFKQNWHKDYFRQIAMTFTRRGDLTSLFSQPAVEAHSNPTLSSSTILSSNLMVESSSTLSLSASSISKLSASDSSQEDTSLKKISIKRTHQKISVKDDKKSISNPKERILKKFKTLG